MARRSGRFSGGGRWSGRGDWRSPPAPTGRVRRTLPTPLRVQRAPRPVVQEAVRRTTRPVRRVLSVFAPTRSVARSRVQARVRIGLSEGLRLELLRAPRQRSKARAVASPVVVRPGHEHCARRDERRRVIFSVGFGGSRAPRVVRRTLESLKGC